MTVPYISFAFLSLVYQYEFENSFSISCWPSSWKPPPCQILRNHMKFLYNGKAFDNALCNFSTSLSFLSHMCGVWDLFSIIYYISRIPFFWPYDGSLWNTNMESNIFPFLLHIGCINHILTKMISDNFFFYLHLASHYTYWLSQIYFHGSLLQTHYDLYEFCFHFLSCSTWLLP